MDAAHAPSGRFGARLGNLLLAGLVAVLPLFLTIWILVFLFRALDGFLSPAVSPVIVHYLKAVGADLPEGARIPGIGLAATAILVLLAGLLVRNIIGRGLVGSLEHVLLRIPLVGSVLASAKQLMGVFSLRKDFSRAVMIEYPRPGSFAVAFATARVDEITAAALGEGGFTYVFVPSTPNPTGGILLMVPDERIFPTGFSVEEGIKLVVTAGILAEEERPPGEKGGHERP